MSPPGFQPQGVGFQKFARSDPFRINTYELSIDELRAHADDIYTTWKYMEIVYTGIFLRISSLTITSFGVFQKKRNSRCPIGPLRQNF
jgi:hypothetical protein